jgi:hypothetical protein
MPIYRDPDDRPVDPVLDDEVSERRPPRRTLPPLIRPSDPDALRPARVLDEDGIPVEPDQPRRPLEP